MTNNQRLELALEEFARVAIKEVTKEIDDIVCDDCSVHVEHFISLEFNRNNTEFKQALEAFKKSMLFNHEREYSESN